MATGETSETELSPPDLIEVGGGAKKETKHATHTSNVTDIKREMVR